MQLIHQQNKFSIDQSDDEEFFPSVMFFSKRLSNAESRFVTL